MTIIKNISFQNRLWLVGGLFTLALISSSSAFTLIVLPPSSGNNQVSGEQQASSATQPVVNPAVGMGNRVSGQVIQSLTGGRRTKGLQFKDPHVGAGLNYRSTEDTIAGGFKGDEYGGDLSFDADVYDGLILGTLYQYTYRGAENSQGTSEHLGSHGVSFYAAKRFLNLLNAGMSYNHVETEHRLTRAINVNLDRDSNGFTAFVGASDRHEKWTWATTPSFTYVYDHYDQQDQLETGLFAWSNTIGYDLCKQLTLSAAFIYNYLAVQNTFGNVAVRDDDYWVIGPRLRYYATKDLTVGLDFDSQQSYNNYNAYTVRLSADFAF